MKRLTILGMAALMAAAVSCKKSGDDAQAPVQGAFRAVAEAQADDSKTSLTGNLAVIWSSEDKIRIFDGKNPAGGNNVGYGDFTLISGAGSSSGEFSEPTNLSASFYSGDYRAFYPADNATYKADGDAGYYMTLQPTQVYAANSFGKNANPMAAKASSTSLSFSNLCGTLRLSLTSGRKDMKVKSITVTSRKAEKLCGEGKVVFGETPALEITGSANTGENSVTLDCGTAGEALPLHSPEPGVEPGKQFNIVLPAGSLMGGFDIEVTYLTNYKTTATFKKGVGGTVDNSIQAGRVRNMPALRIDDGFIVDDMGKVVEFAKGNLYWKRNTTTGSKADAGTWGIEEDPWGCCYLDYSVAAPGFNVDYVSHFFWTDDSEKAYGSTGVAETPENFFTEPDGFLIGETTYHTLSNGEWGYVLNTRPVHTGNHRWAKVYMETGATIKGLSEKVPGLLLFPAEWKEPATGDSYHPFSDNAFIASANWEMANTVSKSDLSGNYAGCVFLPCAGYRNNSTVGLIGKTGYYWSSTNAGSSSWHVFFDSGNVYMRNYGNRNDGFTVRPVHVLQD